MFFFFFFTKWQLICDTFSVQFDLLCGEYPWKRKWQPTPVFLPGESHGERSLAGYSPWGQHSQTLLKQLSTHAWWRPSRKKAEIVKHCHLLLLFPHLLLKQVSFNLCLIEAKDVESSSSQISTGVRITWKVTKHRGMGWGWRWVGDLRGRGYMYM